MKKNLVKSFLLIVLSFTLLGCNNKKDEPIEDKEESTVIKNAKDTTSFLKKKDYKSIAYAFIYNIKEGLQSYESNSSGTVKAKVAMFDYNINYESCIHKKGNVFYSKDHSKSTFTTLDNEFYQIDKEKIVASRDLKKYEVYTVEEYNKMSYAMTQYLIMGYVFNDQSIINTEVISDRGEETSIKYTLDNELATKFVKTDMKVNGGLTTYPKFESIQITLVMKNDFTPVSYSIDAIYEASAPIIGSARTTQQGECIFSKVNENITIPNEAFLAEKLGAEPSKVVIDNAEDAIKEDLKQAFENLDFANGVNINGRFNLYLMDQEIGLRIDSNVVFDLERISGDKIYDILRFYAKLEGDETFNTIVSLVKSFAGDKLGDYAQILDNFKSVEVVYDGNGSIYFLPLNNEDIHSSVVKVKLVDILDIVLKNINVSSLINGAMNDSLEFKKIPGNNEKNYRVEISLTDETILKVKETINKFFENEEYALIKDLIGYKDFDSVKISITVQDEKVSRIEAEANYLKQTSEEETAKVAKLVSVYLDTVSKKYDFTNDIANAEEQYEIYSSILDLKTQLTYLSNNVYPTRSCLEKIEKGIADYEALSEKQKEYFGESIVKSLRESKEGIAVALEYVAIVSKYDLNNLNNETIYNLRKDLSNLKPNNTMLKDLLDEQTLNILGNLGDYVDYSTFDGAIGKMTAEDENEWGLTEQEIRDIKFLLDLSEYESSIRGNIMIKFLMLGRFVDVDKFEVQINNLYNKLEN